MSWSSLQPVQLQPDCLSLTGGMAELSCFFLKLIFLTFYSVFIPLWAPQVALEVKTPLPVLVDERDEALIPGSGRSPGGGHGNALQFSCLQNPMDRGAWKSSVRRVARNQTWLKWLSMHAYTFHYAVILERHYAFLSPFSHTPSMVNSKTIILFILICHLFQETHTLTNLTSSKTLSCLCARHRIKLGPLCVFMISRYSTCLIQIYTFTCPSSH